MSDTDAYILISDGKQLTAPKTCTEREAIAMARREVAFYEEGGSVSVVKLIATVHGQLTVTY